MCRARETRKGKSWYFEIHSLNKFSMSWPEGETAVHTARWLKYIERNECARKREKSKHEKDECEKPEDDEKYHNPATIEIEQMLLFYIINFSFSITSSVQRVGIDRRNSHWTVICRVLQRRCLHTIFTGSWGNESESQSLLRISFVCFDRAPWRNSIKLFAENLSMQKEGSKSRESSEASFR